MFVVCKQVRRLNRLAAADTPTNSPPHQESPQKVSMVVASLSSMALQEDIEVPGKCVVATSKERTLRALRDVTNDAVLKDGGTNVENNCCLGHANRKVKVMVDDEVVVNRQLFAEYQNSIRSRHGLAQ